MLIFSCLVSTEIPCGLSAEECGILHFSVKNLLVERADTLANSQHELREDSFALINGLRELAQVPLCKLICSFINYSCFSV